MTGHPNRPRQGDYRRGFQRLILLDVLAARRRDKDRRARIEAAALRELAELDLDRFRRGEPPPGGAA